MGDILNPLVQKWLGVLIRSGLTALGAYLIGKGWASDQQWTDAAMALTPILASVLWSGYEKVAAMAATEIAKQHPAGTTREDVKDTLDNTSLGTKIKLAANPQ